jgi:hypothetical protein
MVAPAQASLGGTVDSVETDRRSLAADRRSTVTGVGYVVHELEAGGTRVREYLSPGGVVFGVAWDGLAQPDLGALLGSYAAAWREADRQVARAPGRRHRTVATPSLVVERWGRMRHLRGRAFDPTLLPLGVKADEIQ